MQRQDDTVNRRHLSIVKLSITSRRPNNRARLYRPARHHHTVFQAKIGRLSPNIERVAEFYFAPPFGPFVAKCLIQN